MGGCCHSKQMEKFESKELKEVETKEITAEKVGIALYGLQTEVSWEILNFKKGDELIIDDESDPDWYLAHHASGGRKGFVPKTYICLDAAIGIEDWFFGNINRFDAERLLLLPENERGTYMVRNSHIPGTYALSIKDETREKKEVLVRHYKIRRLDKGGFFVAPNKIFRTVQELISYFSEAAHGLCCKLEKPCPKPHFTLPGPSPHARDEYEIPYACLQFVRLLGKGQFGVVHYGLWNGVLEVAIKCLTSSLHREEFLQEVACMKAINHPKIVRLYAVCTEKEPYCIVMEYMCNGNLQAYLRTKHGQSLKLPSLVNMAAQIADGMRYLESHNLLHRDLAARNILVGEGDVVKLSDFGLARIMVEDVYVTKGGKLPIKWTAPEAYTSREFNIKSDVWSFGIVLYEIFTHGGEPYLGMKNKTVSRLISLEEYRMPKPDDPECSEAVYEVMDLCWRKKPEDRPTFEHLYNFFSDYYIHAESAYKEAYGSNSSY